MGIGCRSGAIAALHHRSLLPTRQSTWSMKRRPFEDRARFDADRSRRHRRQIMQHEMERSAQEEKIRRARALKKLEKDCRAKGNRTR